MNEVSAGKGRGVAPPQAEGTADATWRIVGYLGAGMIVYGGLGWLVGWLTGLVTVFVVIGLLLGIGLGTLLTVLRYNALASSPAPSSRSSKAGTPGPDRH